MVTTATLSMTPWAAEALSLTEQREISERAVELHARVNVGMARNTWTIRVDSWAQDAHYTPLHQVAWHRQRGHLADLVQGALDEYERTYVFTNAELVTIANQSGIEVSRA